MNLYFSYLSEKSEISEKDLINFFVNRIFQKGSRDFCRKIMKNRISMSIIAEV